MRWQFDGFVLDVEAGELRRGDTSVKLPPQQFALLSALVQSPGVLLTREALRSRLWGDDVTVDFDAGLNFCVRQLRLALGDAAGDPRFIQTVPRRGYRFIAAVTAVHTSTLDGPASRPRQGAFSPARAAAVFALLAGVLAAGSYVAVRASAAGTTADARIADAHAARGFVALNDDWEWGVAARAFARALQLDGQHEVALISLSRLHAAHGRFDQAVAFARRAVDAHPSSPRALTTLGSALLFSGDAHAAAGACAAAQVRAPQSSAARQCRLHADAERGVGDTGVWARALAAGRLETNPGTWFVRATIEARAGHLQAALNSLTRALRAREPDASFALVHPALAVLRGEPALQAAAREVGLALEP